MRTLPACISRQTQRQSPHTTPHTTINPAASIAVSHTFAHRKASLRVEALEDRVTPVQFNTHLSHLTAAIPNDTSYSSQWGMTKVSAPAAWDVTTGSEKVVVASIDTGVDYTHPDLYLNIWLNQTEIPAAIRGAL